MNKLLAEALRASMEIPIRTQMGVCARPPFGCGGDANYFRDDLSRREYTLSALCQECQDKFYGTGEEE